MLFPEIIPLYNGSSYEVGPVGPGQSFYLDFLPYVNGGKFGHGQYEWANASVPEGWESVRSKMYGVPLRVKIKVASNATPGVYNATIYFYDEGNSEGLGISHIKLKIHVIDDPILVKIRPTKQRVGINQPAIYKIVIKNRGIGADAVSISTEGLPHEYSKVIYLEPNGITTVDVPTWAEQEDVYAARIYVKSLASGLTYTYNITLEVHPTIEGDLGAINDGVLLFPPVLTPFYYFLGIFGG